MTDVQGINSFRWFAPELLGEHPLISTRSDIYSFAMTVLELMTGERPFVEIRKAPSIPTAVASGQRPMRPLDPAVVNRGLDDALWALLVRCWAQEPAERPSIVEVGKELGRMWSNQY